MRGRRQYIDANVLDIMSAVTVSNDTKRRIRVSVATTGASGQNGSYYEIVPGAQQTWNRPSATTVFVIGSPFLTKKNPKAFFVATGATLSIEDRDLN